MKTLILLIDFYGHPALTTDNDSDSVRYSYLTEIIISKLDKKDCVFFSTWIPKHAEKLLELRKIAKDKGFVFEIPTKEESDLEDEIYSVDYIKSKFKDFNIDKTDTQIIVAGTNTSGCVFSKKGIGAYQWYRHGYKTKIYLPMCAEYEKKGINDFERNMLGITSLFKKMQKLKCFNLKICEEIGDLKLTYLSKK
mgnify:FL=1